MSAGTLVSIEEYLSTSYRPDRDYIEGVLQERNVGEWSHGRLQGALFVYFSKREKTSGLFAGLEQRVQVARDRFRIPDVCLVRESDVKPIITEPPVLCIEVLSRDDTVSSLEERVNDYLQFGVPTVWVLDPATRRGYVYTAGGIRTEALDGILRAANPGFAGIELPMSELAR